MTGNGTAPYTLTARPTTYKGVEMRSRLEANFARLLDKWGIPWQYEPRCYADETGQYLPDFETTGWSLPAIDDFPGGQLKYPLFVETKPIDIAFNGDDTLNNRYENQMRIIRSTMPLANLCIWFPEDTWVLLSLPSERFRLFGTGSFALCQSCARYFLISDWDCYPYAGAPECPDHRGAPLRYVSALYEED